MKSIYILALILVCELAYAQCESKYVTQTMNLRKSPDKTSEVIGKKLQGEMVWVDMSEEENGFVPVKTDYVCEKVLGYVWSAFLSNQPKQYSSGNSNSGSSSSSKSGCGPSGVTLQRGSRGGCYYYSGKTKVYVDRSCCN